MRKGSDNGGSLAQPPCPQDAEEEEGAGVAQSNQQEP